MGIDSRSYLPRNLVGDILFNFLRIWGIHLYVALIAAFHITVVVILANYLLFTYK